MEHRLESFVARLRRTGEGRILWIGILLWAALVAELAVVAVWSLRMARYLGAGIVTEIFLGREGGIPISLEGGAPLWLVAQVSFTQDIAAVAVAFPVFLWWLHRYHDRDNWFMRRLRRIEAAAARHEAYVHRWGPLGIFFFMLVPFAINGPLAGAVVGRIAGIPTRYLLWPVLASTAVAAVAWTFAFDFAKNYLDRADHRLAPVLTAAIIGLLLAWMLYSEWKERHAGSIEGMLVDDEP